MFPNLLAGMLARALILVLFYAPVTRALVQLFRHPASTLAASFVLLIVVAAGPAHAADSNIVLKPVFDALGPIVGDMIAWAVVTAGVWLLGVLLVRVNALAKKLGITTNLKVDEKMRAALTQAANVGAGVIKAKMDGSFATAKFDVGNELVAHEVNSILARFPDAVAHFGGTAKIETSLERMILGAIGDKQIAEVAANPPSPAS